MEQPMMEAEQAPDAEPKAEASAENAQAGGM